MQQLGNGFAGKKYNGSSDIELAGYSFGSGMNAGMGAAETAGGMFLMGIGSSLTGGGTAACVSGIGCTVGAPAIATGVAATGAGYGIATDGLGKLNTSLSNVMQAKDAQESKFPNKPLLGTKGTKVNSTTVGKGKGWRIDVENPAPGKRAGQIHYQNYKGNKYLYNPNIKSFLNISKTLNKQLLKNPQIMKAINKGLKILGEK